jgi:Na+/H+-dicarboxylate symporter
MSKRFTLYILAAMGLGIILGWYVYTFLNADRVTIGNNVNLIAILFLRLIKMIIAHWFLPLWSAASHTWAAEPS